MGTSPNIGIVNLSIGINTTRSLLFSWNGRLFRKIKCHSYSRTIRHIKISDNQRSDHIFVTMLIQGLFYGATINAVAAFGEEYGWRGFLQQQYSYMGFWRMSLVIGFIWGLWHIPIIIQGYNYPQNPILGMGMMTIFTILFTPLISYIRIKSGSVIPAAIMHGTLNATAGIAIIFTRGGSDLTVGVTGIS